MTGRMHPSSPGHLPPPPADTETLRSRLLAVLMDEYGGEAEDWTAMHSLSRVLAVIENAR